MIEGNTWSEYNSGEIQYRDFLLAEFFSRQTYNLDKWSENYFHTILGGNLEIRRLLGGWFGLWNQNLLYHKCSIFYNSMSFVYVSACHKPQRGNIFRAQKYIIKCMNPWIFGKNIQKDLYKSRSLMKPSNRHKHNITLWVGRLKKTVIKASGKSSTPSAETRNEYDLSQVLLRSLSKKIQ